MRESLTFWQRALLCLVVAVGSVSAELPPAYTACLACHGANGEGNPALKAPALASLNADYIVRQLNNFADGHRGTAEGDATGAQMTAFATMLNEADRQAIAQGLALLPSQRRPATIDGDAAKGEKLFNANCGDCHGAFAEGNEAFSAPRLVGQHDQYLFDQVMKFKNGQRGYAADDRLGRQMAFMSSEIADETALRHVVAYIQSLPVPAP
ncbi:c-type cytochrome [Reinekea blandensis]|uniref:Cytochrome c family protein n=1 Tax=Reinekea blandensis MED297 TaxID=314283 RepID=A4BKK2_9GAMM|nr:c-type cytochrome [Reinekea blandensis]EAR07355.1 cytochrome c family protein [Reinekea sp. MED297] [Reinekea blandensis MED297]